MDIAFPFAIDGHGRTARADEAAHVRQTIEQLIFTAPGERVNRPGFGSGIQQLAFAPNSPELAATLQFTLQAAIQQTLWPHARPSARKYFKKLRCCCECASATQNRCSPARATPSQRAAATAS